jgi:bacteriorhodopsin
VAEEKKSWTLTVGWLLILLVGLLITLGGLASMAEAYRATEDRIAGVSLADLAKLSPDLPNAIRGRRATAASLAITSGLLVCWIAATVYKRGEKWAWYALLSSLGIGSILSILRIPLLGLSSGVGAPAVMGGVMLVALLISFRDFK